MPEVDVVRFFMTIPEAVQLVIRAALMGEGGEIFVLDMGEPIKILDLAKEIISLSGLEPGKDVPIEFIGLKPGEKLIEHLTAPDEEVCITSHEKIMKIKHNCTQNNAFKGGEEEIRKKLLVKIEN